MALAVEAFHAADTSEARAALAAFEGQPTIHRFTGSTGLDGPNDGGIAYGKDRLAITDSLGSVDLNSLAGGADRHFASNASGPVHERFKGVPTDTTALSADGALIAAGHGRSIAVRDTDTGKLRARLGLPESSEKFPTQLRKVRFSPDGHYLALGYDDATAVFRDLSREEGKRNLPGTLLGVFASGTGTASETTVVTREQDKVTWWDAATGSARKRFTLPQASEAAYLALSPDGTRIAYSTSALRTRVWDLVEQRTVLDVADGSSQVRALAFSPDGATLATSGFDPAIRLWDLNSGKNTLTLTGHTGWLFQLVFGPDGTTLASAAADGSTRVWRTTPAERQKTLSWHDKAVLALAYSPDGKTLAAVTDDATFLGDPTAGGTAHTGVDSSPGQGGGLGLGFSADGTTLMTANMTIDLWDLASGKHRSSVDVAGPLHAAAFTPDARRVAVVGETSLVELRNPTSTEPGRTLTGREDDLFIAVAWSRDEATVVAAASNGRVRAWNAATGATRWEAGLEKTRLTAVAVSPDGGTVAAAGEDGRVWILDAGNGKVRAIAEDPARREKLRTVAFSPDSRVIAAAGEDRAVRLWESATGALSETLEGHTDKINAVAFSPDGRILASADDRGRILLTRAASLADPQATVKAICRLGRPGLTQDQWQTYMAGTRQRATCY
ncbi:WD40 repeat domain-containing protein [Streptomyces sp. NPDC054904]|uniref:WD40 repeat domain-containing protein n=1 Tax=Streptomyces sp. NPDC090054 TaxID=3365933 RepID=UPI0038292F48